ncbi:MAG: hypothetical protein M5R38_02605 [Candidatus Methylomirabilis sp.]|nr:hypothetical protein [Candidatus Methylomirabilis sp.]
MRGGRILIVAGEPSGDLHAAGVVTELLRRAPSLTIEGIGGDRMRQAGVRLHVHAGDLAVVGLVEVAARLPAIWRAYRGMTRYLREQRPDLVILVDFPDFNLRLARAASRLGIPVVYFIGPQVWAWRAGRIRLIARYVRRLLVIFPFEEEFYRERGVEALYVGHPILDRSLSFLSTGEARRRLELDGEAPVLGLLPGSRVGELTRHLPILLRTAKQLMTEHSDLRVMIAAADGLPSTSSAPA